MTISYFQHHFNRSIAVSASAVNLSGSTTPSLGSTCMPVLADHLLGAAVNAIAIASIAVPTGAAAIGATA